MASRLRLSKRTLWRPRPGELERREEPWGRGSPLLAPLPPASPAGPSAAEAAGEPSEKEAPRAWRALRWRDARCTSACVDSGSGRRREVRRASAPSRAAGGASCGGGMRPYRSSAQACAPVDPLSRANWAFTCRSCPSTCFSRAARSSITCCCSSEDTFFSSEKRSTRVGPSA
jgi:hypothetical protein